MPSTHARYQHCKRQERRTTLTGRFDHHFDGPERVGNKILMGKKSLHNEAQCWRLARPVAQHVQLRKALEATAQHCRLQPCEGITCTSTLTVQQTTCLLPAPNRRSSSIRTITLSRSSWLGRARFCTAWWISLPIHTDVAVTTHE